MFFGDEKVAWHMPQNADDAGAQQHVTCVLRALVSEGGWMRGGGRAEQRRSGSSAHEGGLRRWVEHD